MYLSLFNKKAGLSVPLASLAFLGKLGLLFVCCSEACKRTKEGLTTDFGISG